MNNQHTFNHHAGAAVLENGAPPARAKAGMIMLHGRGAEAELLLFRAHEKFDENGVLTDESTRSFLGKYLSAYTEWVKRFS